MSEIADLFARDPLKLTREDRTKIIEHQRTNRALFMQGNKTAARPEKTAKAPKEKKSLGDLDI